MQQATQLYGKVAKQIAAPRDLEAGLLLKSAAKLQAIHDDWETERANLYDALTYNRKLWTLFTAANMVQGHPLPSAIRQNIVNLGVFVMKQTLAITQNPQREALRSLIGINREIAAGLRPGPQI
jgi:flagellar protein FlaF